MKESCCEKFEPDPGLFYPPGLLDPMCLVWREVSWSDASLAASSLSEEAVGLSCSPLNLTTAAACCG